MKVIAIPLALTLTGCAGLGSSVWDEVASNWRDTSLGQEPNLFEQTTPWDRSSDICCASGECEW